jgi:hypothetical protein
MRNWEGHHLRLGRFQRGMTAIAPSRPLYGTTGRCECGATFRSNETPSKGGQTRVKEAHRAHVDAPQVEPVGCRQDRTGNQHHDPPSERG